VAERGARTRRRQRLKLSLLVVVALVAIGGGLGLYGSDALRRLDLDTVDARFSVRGDHAPPRDIVIVAMDTATFGDLKQFPLPRRYHADVLNQLRRAGARVIAYDVQFTEPSSSPAQDLALLHAADAASPVVFATTETDGHGGTNVLGGNRQLRSIGDRPANALLPDDPQGVIRRFEHDLGGLDTFAVATVEDETGRRVPRPPGGNVSWIDFAGPAGTFPSVSFSDVVNRRVPDAFFRGKTVIVGPTAPSLQDLHPTSTDSSMSGPEIQANAIATVRAGYPLTAAASFWDVLLIVALGAVAPLAAMRLAPLTALVMPLVTGVAFVVAAQLLFDHGAIVTGVYPLVALAVGTFGAVVVQYFTETRERARLRGLFGRFVPESVVDQVVDRADEDLRLGGVRLECTVLFADLRKFTTFAESVEPRLVIDVLNEYLEEMSSAILDHGGTLVSYQGDGVMAVFGAPLEDPDHADRALAAAREMLEVRMPRFNARLTERLGLSFRMGIGINSGPVMSGNVGSLRRLAYTAVGDTTNTAARLEELTKGTAYQLFVSGATRDLLSDGAADLVLHADVALRGREEATTIWALPDARSTD
jgi:adenylate cyclase